MFKKATKEQAKLRCAIFGASGSGKTYSALRIAKGLGNKIALIDSERASACKYSDRFNFDVAELESKNIESYVSYIKSAGQAKYDILIIDSLSHAWTELLQEVDSIAKAKFRGNTWSAWSEGTPKQRQLVDAILSFPGHIIATMRCKTEWTLETTSKGSTKPIRVALAPEQGKGIEYEFDLLLELSPEHIGNVIKDRTGKFQDKIIKLPDENFGQQLKDWLSEGADPDIKINGEQLAAFSEEFARREFDERKFMEYAKIETLRDIKLKDYIKLLTMLQSKPLKHAPQTSIDSVGIGIDELINSDNPEEIFETTPDVKKKEHQKALDTLKKLEAEKQGSK